VSFPSKNQDNEPLREEGICKEEVDNHWEWNQIFMGASRRERSLMLEIYRQPELLPGQASNQRWC
jgi:hypothetical protein